MCVLLQISIQYPSHGLDKLFSLFLKIYSETHNVKVSLSEVWDKRGCVGLEPNFRWPPPLICGPVPLLARNQRTVKRAFPNLPKAHRDDLL